MSEEGTLLERLEQRRPGLEGLEAAWRMIDDVLASRVKRQSGGGWSSDYFPRGRLEPAGEYSLRVELTPFFPQTPALLAARLGALFRTRPEVRVREGGERIGGRPGGAEGDRGLAAFLKRAGRRHASFEDVAVQAACLAQSHGFCAVLLDRDPLPEDARGRGVTRAEAEERGLGRPYLALYAAPEVLDWEYGSDGRLLWVKFGERELWRPRWDAAPEWTRVYRIVDRERIHVYRARGGGAEALAVHAAEPQAHGFSGRVPVCFLHPFPGQDGVGRPILQRAAEADIAAARVLSDLVWDLFVLGNPILTLKTSRPDEELGRLGLGATRYIPLRNGKPGEEHPEALEFVQFDPAGIELLFRAHALFSSQASRQAGGGDDVAATPRQQSGIAQAWRFRTGEERVLFMLARALEAFLSEALSLAWEALQRRSGVEEARGEVEVKLTEEFGVAAA
jgi:hypothetical protein